MYTPPLVVSQRQFEEGYKLTLDEYLVIDEYHTLGNVVKSPVNKPVNKPAHAAG